MLQTIRVWHIVAAIALWLLWKLGAALESKRHTERLGGVLLVASACGFIVWLILLLL